jgi:hypothetical protein
VCVCVCVCCESSLLTEGVGEGCVDVVVKMCEMGCLCHRSPCTRSILLQEKAGGEIVNELVLGHRIGCEMM